MMSGRKKNEKLKQIADFIVRIFILVSCTRHKVALTGCGDPLPMSWGEGMGVVEMGGASAESLLLLTKRGVSGMKKYKDRKVSRGTENVFHQENGCKDVKIIFNLCCRRSGGKQKDVVYREKLSVLFISSIFNVIIPSSSDKTATTAALVRIIYSSSQAHSSAFSQLKGGWKHFLLVVLLMGDGSELKCERPRCSARLHNVCIVSYCIWASTFSLKANFLLIKIGKIAFLSTKWTQNGRKHRTIRYREGEKQKMMPSAERLR